MRAPMLVRSGSRGRRAVTAERPRARDDGARIEMHTGGGSERSGGGGGGEEGERERSKTVTMASGTLSERESFPMARLPRYVRASREGTAPATGHG